MAFQGFEPPVVDFMWGIRFNNERSWFLAHKQEYLHYFYEPMKALAGQIYQLLAEQNQDLDLVCKVSRIYRDARRLHGRGPYKDHLWLSIERPHEDWTCDPVFWFELTPEGYSYGLGYWRMEPGTAARFRARLDRDPKPFEKLVRPLQKQSVFRLEGEEYKRPKGPAPSKLLEPWYNKKGFSLSHNGAHSEVLSDPELPVRLAAEFQTLIPLYRYLVTLNGDPDPAM